VSVVHVEECIRAHLSGQKIDTIDVASGLISQTIYFENDFLVLVQVSGQCAVHGFADSQAVSVIGTDHSDAIGGYRGDQLVKEVVGVGELYDRGLGDTVDIGGMGLQELVAVVVIGIGDGFRRDALKLRDGSQESVQGIVGIGCDSCFRSEDNRLGGAVAGCVVGVGCDFFGGFCHGGKAVQDVIGIGCDSAAVKKIWSSVCYRITIAHTKHNVILHEMSLYFLIIVLIVKQSTS